MECSTDLRFRCLFHFFACIFILCFGIPSMAQSGNSNDSLHYPRKENQHPTLEQQKNLVSLSPPSNVEKIVEFDPMTQTYVIYDAVGGRPVGLPKLLTMDEYKDYVLQETQDNYWAQKSGQGNEIVQNRGLIPRLDFKSAAFDNLFGGSFVDFRLQGFAEITLATRTNKNNNPLLSTRQQKQTSLDFQEALQVNLEGSIGTKLNIQMNFNSQSQFDFENQVHFVYTGHEDEIIRKIEVGNVNMSLPGTLISGSQSLFGLKTELQFGKLAVTALVSSQRSDLQEIVVTNGAQETQFEIRVDNYEANKHYFLAQYFLDNYNEALSRVPVITSGIVINKIEVWVTNRTNNNNDSRDILAFLDLGENDPFNKVLFTGGAGYSPYPSGYVNPQTNVRQSNNLLSQIPSNARYTRSTAINTYFATTGSGDNYAKLTYARKLTEREYKLNDVLGYISLNQSLNNDEVLAVAFRYTLDGVQYQVGEFSTDLSQDPTNPVVLFVKLLKNEMIKTSLPTWNLMMKNIYNLNGYQISSENFRLNIYRTDPSSGVTQPVMPQGENITGVPYLQLMHLDRMNVQENNIPDGIFDFIPGITIDPTNGRLIFPVVQPFGKSFAAQFTASETALASQYVYQPLYDSTKFIAQQFTDLNRFIIKGSFKSAVTSEYNLNAVNIPHGSVIVMAGPTRLTEGIDYTVDYNLGTVKIINESLLNSGQPIKIQMESTELYGVQAKTMAGLRLDYPVNDKLSVGGTFMSLTEKPLTQKVSMGSEPVSNQMYGVDASYRTESMALTRWLNGLPLLKAKEKSVITMKGEFAQLFQGHSKALNIAGDKGGSSYIDDFETTRSIIDLKSSTNWFISGTPQGIPNAELINDLRYGYQRALLSYYIIDPVFYSTNNNQTPSNIRNNNQELSNPYVREVTEQEVFPNKQSVTGAPLYMPTFDVAYYPTKRGPYNYSTDVNMDGSLINPGNNWGGIFRRLDQNDFQALNVEYIEFWVMDPFLGNPNSTGGDLYFNLGSISEDILKDGSKSLENALPANGDPALTIETAWGRVGITQPVTQGFDNNPDARAQQDVGIDGLSSAAEQNFFSPYLAALRPKVSAAAYQTAFNDPSSDDFVYFLGPQLDAQNASILERYKYYNGMEGNSRTAKQSMDLLGIPNASSTSMPDGEDINRDNTMSTTEAYFQYRVSVRRQDMEVGRNFITDQVTSNVKLANGSVQPTTWYQFQIPLGAFENSIGSIEDFRSIRFVRMFMTGFQDSIIMRFAKLQLARGEWIAFNPSNKPSDNLIQPGLPSAPPPDNSSSMNLSAINIEENGNRTPIPYVLPPGIQQQVVQGAYRETVRLNEQSLLMNVVNLPDGYIRACFKNLTYNFLRYKRLKMFIHTEALPTEGGGTELIDHDVYAIIRLGIDYDQNYYQYAIPMKVTPPYSTTQTAIWPNANELDMAFETLQNLKMERNRLKIPQSTPYSVMDGRNIVTIVGNPDLSKTKTIMLGVMNPQQGSIPGEIDDGREKSAQVWFNELRVADFKEDKGVAVTGLVSAQLSDFGTVNVAGYFSSVGFGSLSSNLNQTNRSQNSSYDVSSTIDLGRLVPEKASVAIPMYVSFAQDIVKYEYSPIDPDLLLKDVLRSLTPAEQDSLKSIANDVATRTSINFTNVRKIRKPDREVHFYDIENFNATFAFTQLKARSYTVEKNQQTSYKAILGYNFQKESKNIKPFDSLWKTNSWKLFKDFNFNIAPQLVGIQVFMNRFYDENMYRATSENFYFPTPATYNKSLYLDGLYNLGWQFSPSLRVDYSGQRRASVDEPAGAITKESRDSLLSNLIKGGRPIQYQQRVAFTYALPMTKIAPLAWTSFNVRYSTDYEWLSEPLSTLRSDTARMGNTIRNAYATQLSGQFNLAQVYNKFDFLKSPNPSKFEWNDVYRAFATMVKNVSGTYANGRGTFLPGYLPTTKLFLGQPGLGFMMGSQKDIRYDLVSAGDLTTYTGMNNLYVVDRRMDISYRSMIEPVKDWRLELSGTKGSVVATNSNFRYNPEFDSFIDYSPTTTGSETITVVALGSSFKNPTQVFHTMESYRMDISHRLGASNPNSVGYDDGGYSDGYGRAQQEVVMASFVAAYRGKNPSKMSEKLFPSVPLPNWRMSYSGLTKLGSLSDYFSSIVLNHAYRAVQAVNNYSSNLDYETDVHGDVISRSPLADDNGNHYFITKNLINTLTISEDFSPLIGVDMRFKNNVTTNVEYRRSRMLSMGLGNSQLSTMFDNQIIFGFGYRKAKVNLPFGLARGLSLENDLTARVDFSFRDNVTWIYQLDVEEEQIAGGTGTFSFRPSIDYLINNRFNFRIFLDQSITSPKTSSAFRTSYTSAGFTIRVTL